MNLPHGIWRTTAIEWLVLFYITLAIIAWLDRRNS